MLQGEEAAVEVGLEEVFGVQLALEGEEFLDAVLGVEGGEARRVQGGVFGEVEAAPGVQNNRVQGGGQLSEAVAVAGGDREIQGEGVAIAAVTEREGVRAVP